MRRGSRRRGQWRDAAPIRVSDFEVEAGTRYTVDTLGALLAPLSRSDRFIWLMGADTAARIPPVEGLAANCPNGADCGLVRARAMMTMPARRARWAGCGGSSAPRPWQGSGRTGVHRRLSSFACRPIRHPPPPARARPRLAPPLPLTRRRATPSADIKDYPCPTVPCDRRNRRSRSTSSAARAGDADRSTTTRRSRWSPSRSPANRSIADHMVIASGRSTPPGRVDGDQAGREDQAAVRPLGRGSKGCRPPTGC